MESPFANFIEETTEEYRALGFQQDEILKLSPLMEPGEADNEILFENQLPPAALTTKVGEVTFAIADNAKAMSDEFREPNFSGNPLLIIPPADRKINISKNFQVGEFAQAQSQQYKFSFARIDPSLVENVQRLRTFFGKKMEIVDGYYSPKYLREVLKINDALKIKQDPNVTGRSVKINAPGYKGMMKQLAIAAMVSCDKDINIGIGSATMTLSVKQPVASDSDSIPIDFQRITSYITDEEYAVANYTFCVDVKRLLSDHYSAYESPMHKAVSGLAVSILKFHYNQNSIPVEWLDWETHLRNIISVMYDKSKTKDPNVILYCLAYSPFGNLYRFYFKDTAANALNTVNSIIEELTSDTDRQNRNVPDNFIAVQNLPDKKRFIDYCRQRFLVGRKAGTNSYHLVPSTFFDWNGNSKDNLFLVKMTTLIKDVFFTNRYHYDVPVQQSPVGGTLSNLQLSAPAPDKPVNDFTGRYWAPYPANDRLMYGRYILINQAGNYVSGKLGAIFKNPIKNLRNTITEFYGKIDEQGNLICNLYPQQTLIIKKIQNETKLFITDNAANKLVVKLPLISRSKNPVVSNRIVNSFSYISKKHEDLLLTLAWIHPLPNQLKVFFESFKKSESDIREAITKYYNEDETVPSVKANRLSGYVNNLDAANNNYLKLPPMFIRFAAYYTKYFYSVSPRWSPGSDREKRTTLDWIKKMLEDYRDLKGTLSIEKRFSRLYEYFAVDTKIPAVYYEYAIKMKLSAYGFGPFARSSGNITIENKTDYGKYPKAEKWQSPNSEDFPITLWNATLSLNPGKWLPKISAGQSIEAEIKTNSYYSASDFSGADVQVTEGKVFEIPIGKTSGGVKASTKIGIGGVIVLIDGHGKKTLEFTADEDLALPDTVDIEPSTENADEGTFEKIAGFLPSITMYKGSIGTKATSFDIVTVPLAENFKTSYQLKDTRYFLHDNATLSLQAIEAIGKLCAEELVAFSDPNSVIEIYGHADASGKPGYNLMLSETRAKNTSQAIADRLGNKLKAKIKKVSGLGETEANKKFGQFNQKNAWLRKVIVIINGRAVLSLGEL